MSRCGPLEGIRVLDLGHALAGPFAATMLADFGAEVIKVERPAVGDSMRGLGPKKDGVSLWWKAAGRNKKSMTLDFTTAAGRGILLDLVRKSDVVIENFRPGTLERHGLGWDTLRQANPKLVMLRISGFGQYGPKSGSPGFGRIAEAMSGAAHLTGDPEGSPGHVGFSLADTTAGLMGAFGVTVALLSRAREGRGECIDLALFEPLFRLIDWQVTVYHQLNEVPQRAGVHFPDHLGGVAAGVARTKDGVWMSYSSATDTVLVRLIRLTMGPEALESPELSSSEGRRVNGRQVEVATDAWIAARKAHEVEEAFAEAEVPVGRVYDMSQIWSDPTYRERDDIVIVDDEDLGEVAMHGVIPKFRNFPGRVVRPGPRLGADTDTILHQHCGLSRAQVELLRREGVV